MDIKQQLADISFDGDVVDYDQVYELIDSVSLMEKTDQARTIPALFEFIETHFDKDLGSPGPFVHFLEEQDYEQELLESLRRKPTELTVHMVNRILNSLSGIEHTRWLKELEIVLVHPKADSEAKECAKEYLDHQKSKT